MNRFNLTPAAISDLVGGLDPAIGECEAICSLLLAKLGIDDEAVMKIVRSNFTYRTVSRIGNGRFQCRH